MVRLLVLTLSIAAVHAAPLQSQACWTNAPRPERGEWRVQKSFYDLHVCGVARELRDSGEAAPSQWQARAAVVVLETIFAGEVRTMRLAGDSVTFTVNDAPRAIDSSVVEWRSALVEVLDDNWRVGRPRRSTAINEVRRDSGLVGMAASAPAGGDLASSREELTDLKATSRDLHSEIAAIRADQNLLSKDMRYEQSSISLLQSQMNGASQAERARISREIQRLYQEIQRLDSRHRQLGLRALGLENRLASLDFPRKAEKLEQQIRGLESGSMRPEPEQRSTQRDLEPASPEAGLQRLRTALQKR